MWMMASEKNSEMMLKIDLESYVSDSDLLYK
jgi:hypothetical protein